MGRTQGGRVAGASVAATRRRVSRPVGLGRAVRVSRVRPASPWRVTVHGRPRGSAAWLGGVSAAALVLLSVLTVVVRGQIVAEQYALAESQRECARWDRHLRELDVRLMEAAASLVAPVQPVLVERP